MFNCLLVFDCNLGNWIIIKPHTFAWSHLKFCPVYIKPTQYTTYFIGKMSRRKSEPKTSGMSFFLVLDIILVYYTTILYIDFLFCPYSVSSDWTSEHLKSLLAAMKTNIQKKDENCSYTRGLQAMDWTKVAFPPFSPEECQEKCGMILQKVGHSVTFSWLKRLGYFVGLWEDFLLYVAPQYSRSTGKM